jgi:four helix bundle protein
MKEANPILAMTYRFALDATTAARFMRERKEYDLASQFWRAGTRIGANAEEAQAFVKRYLFQ